MTVLIAAALVLTLVSVGSVAVAAMQLTSDDVSVVPPVIAIVTAGIALVCLVLGA